MRLTPAQCGMQGLLGRLLPMGSPRNQSLADRIRDGRAFVARIADVDPGSDPQAWHVHLRATNAGGQAFTGSSPSVPRRKVS